MKKIYLLASAACGLLAMTGCSDERELCVSEGNLVLTTTYNSDVKVVSRASLEEDLAESTVIWISSEKGLVRKYEGLENLPTEGIKLVGGNYVAEAWAGDSLSADFEKKYFKAREAFEITSGTTAVNLECKIANVVASVVYPEGFEDALSDYTMTIGHRRGSLVFEGNDDRKGYYMMPSNDKDLTWTLAGVQSDGTQFTKTGKILDAQPATEYVLTVVYNPQNDELGGAIIDVVVDESTVDVEDSFTITAAPQIAGIGFDINKPITGDYGNIGKKSVYITGAVSLQSVLVVGEDLTKIIGGNDIDLMGADEEIINELRDAGIYFELYSKELHGELVNNSNMKISFDEEFTDNIEGEHSFVITVTDAKGKSRTATLKFNVTDALVQTDEIAADSPAIWATKATLTATILKEDATNLGFDYKKKDADEWIHVDGVMSRGAGDSYYATLTDLEPGTTYVYRATADNFISTSEATFTTEPATQLENAGFENWCMTGNVQRVYGAGQSMYWDSGNEGATTLGPSYNLTVPESDIKHSGNYSAKLESRKVVIKFAAGNIFIGKYLNTDGTDGVLGWGRSFTSRPKALKGYVKYTPKTVDNANGGGLNKNDMDQGIIYIAILDGTTTSYGAERWPAVIKTKQSERSLFDPAGDNVIAYGEKVFTAATEGDGLIEFEIPLTYFKEDVKAVNILLTCSASRYGDYFTGGAGSVMYIDDFELVY